MGAGQRDTGGHCLSKGAFITATRGSPVRICRSWTLSRGLFVSPADSRRAVLLLDAMPHLWLLFCPYLPLPPTDETVAFADWELGPQESFTNRWADHKFKDQATAFLSKFVGPNGKPIKPALLCREGKQLNGQRPSCNEFTALELSFVFAFIDKNPKDFDQGWGAVTADNAELHLWPIDVEHGNITLSTGYLVKVNSGGYRISNPELVLRPPLDLHLPMGAPSPDPLVLTRHL